MPSAKSPEEGDRTKFSSGLCFVIALACGTLAWALLLDASQSRYRFPCLAGRSISARFPMAGGFNTAAARPGSWITAFLWSRAPGVHAPQKEIHDENDELVASSRLSRDNIAPLTYAPCSQRMESRGRRNNTRWPPPFCLSIGDTRRSGKTCRSSSGKHISQTPRRRFRTRAPGQTLR
jgi:hypothetical protein